MPFSVAYRMVVLSGLFFAVPGASHVLGSGSQVYMDDSCNGVTGLTNSGKPCRPDAAPQDPAYSRGYDDGYRRGYQEALGECRSSSAPGQNAGRRSTERAPDGAGHGGGGEIPRAGSPSASGRGGGASLQHCLRAFYDPNRYNWLTLENTCSVGIHVVFRSRTGYSSGSVELNPGRSSSTGSSRREVEQVGGLAYAVCPLGSSPRTADGRYWDNATAAYHCEQTTR